MDDWYSAPIIPSGNHIADSPVFLTFYFRAETSTDSTTGVIELICPTDVSCITNSVIQAVNGDMDNIVYFESVIVTAGTFGPFGLVTRNQIGGSIVDANYMFGHITILPDVTPGIITVTASDKSITTIGIGKSIDLDFTFTLTVDLWKYDVIVIGVSSDYTASSSPTCTSQDILEKPNWLKGSAGTTSLDCTRDADGNIEIYGLSVDVFSEGNY